MPGWRVEKSERQRGTVQLARELGVWRSGMTETAAEVKVRLAAGSSSN